MRSKPSQNGIAVFPEAAIRYRRRIRNERVKLIRSDMWTKGILWAAVIGLALQLAGCGASTPNDAAPQPSDRPSTAATDSPAPAPSAPSPTPEDAGKARNHAPDGRASSETDVGASGTASSTGGIASPAGGSAQPPAENAVVFDAEHPALGGIALGIAEADVSAKLGAPGSRYALPDGDSQIGMNEYEGMTVGFDPDGKAVYVEISTEASPSGIQGLSIGMNAGEAARLLSVEKPSGSNVIAARVSGGLLKLDLDPRSQDVLSIKLIGDGK
ncbi:hypothetical protein [Cohnella nanjingensis]|uniref:Uncharacterized protein n=1 Tax=Cohnella nanjingensis TaxID=1387779 RepID=A0A7X0RWZ1_9BACL|nr:hypothetical protein [Cohnella nanjingensis]MBB6675171.1 hypothetical protein [Cohnella nanjingensis]